MHQSDNTKNFQMKKRQLISEKSQIHHQLFPAGDMHQEQPYLTKLTFFSSSPSPKCCTLKDQSHQDNPHRYALLGHMEVAEGRILLFGTIPFLPLATEEWLPCKTTTAGIIMFNQPDSLSHMILKGVVCDKNKKTLNFYNIKRELLDST